MIYFHDRAGMDKEPLSTFHFIERPVTKVGEGLVPVSGYHFLHRIVGDLDCQLPFEVRTVNKIDTMVTCHSRSELYEQPPPPFGHALLKFYALDPEYINLNNGGVAPTVSWKVSVLIAHLQCLRIVWNNS